MIDTAFTLFIENLGGESILFAFMGAILSFTIVVGLIDYIND